MITQGTGGVSGVSGNKSATSNGKTDKINNPQTSPEVTTSNKAKATPAATKSGDTAKVIAKITREQFVRIMATNASSVEVSAIVLPTKQLDPRDNTGREIVRLSNGTKFSGEYLLTEVVTEYASGKRTRSISGVGVKLDGLNVVPINTSGVGKITGKDKAKVSTETASTTASNNPNSSSSGSNSSTNKAPTQKPNVPSAQMQLGKDGVWREVK